MTDPVVVLAFDFGASTGRAIKGTYDGTSLQCEEIHRFENIPLEKDGHLYWDMDLLLGEIRTGIQKAGTFDSLAFDTWGVDFGLLDESGTLLQNPMHYRDLHTKGWVDRISEQWPAKKIYERTGNQIMEINTLFQLLALKDEQPELLKRTKKLLFMPDLFAASLGAEAVCEKSIASTSQMLSPVTGMWDKELLDSLDINPEILSDPIESGTITGTLPGGEKIIAVAGHDTQCAVAAVPWRAQTSERAAFLSCGTWSLIGTELDAPILTKESCEQELSNEVGANGKINYLKNITGLWILQESRREYQRQGQEYSFGELAKLAEEAKPLQCFIDPDAPEFANPGNLPERIREFCKRTNQPIPETVGETMRCVYESLALKYRQSLEQISKETGKTLEVLHILGGGTKAELLCQMAADCCGIPVEAGPVEATALGNMILQLKALGAVSDLEEGKKLVAQAEEIKEYRPVDTESECWKQAYERFKEIVK